MASLVHVTMITVLGMKYIIRNSKMKKTVLNSPVPPSIASKLSLQVINVTLPKSLFMLNGYDVELKKGMHRTTAATHVAAMIFFVLSALLVDLAESG